jgi:ribosomal-protein-alanine N-acetyltransferase
MKTVPYDLTLTPMRRRDLRRVMTIEHEVFPEPWSMTIFTSELALRTGRTYRVARVGRIIVAYYGLMYALDEAHITTIAVAPEFQGQGVATSLMLDAMGVARDVGAKSVSLEVAVSNARAQSLYRTFGFAPVGVRRNYYPLTKEDAFVMWAYDVDSPAYAARLGDIAATLRSRQ